MILNLLDRMKLPFRKNKEFLSALYDILGFYPHNIEIYRIAFAHKSLSYRRDNNKDRKGRDRKPRSENTSKPLNNERLEYLGDAVLETVVSDILFRHFEHKREGFLTSTRSKIVQREALNRLATEMGLEKLIRAAQGTRVDHTNIGGNAFEALMGAIYLDRGFQHCHWFIANRIIGHYIDLDSVAQKEVNFKSKLLEWSQKNRINTKFNDTANDDSEKGFQSVIVMETITIGRGSGRSKKESQQAASKEALTRMRRDPKVYDSIFRAKEKRTAMEAEESFALPKIDEIENSLNKGNNRKSGKKDSASPVLEEKDSNLSTSDAAYDLAYDENAKYEVIDTPPAKPQLTAADYEARGLPAPPEENELITVEDKATKRRNRNRAPKTVNDAVKGFKGNKSKAADTNESLTPENQNSVATPQSCDNSKNAKVKAASKGLKKEKQAKSVQTTKNEFAATAQPAVSEQAPTESAQQPLEKPCDEKPEIDLSPLQTLQAKVVLDNEAEKTPVDATLFDEEQTAIQATDNVLTPKKEELEEPNATVSEKEEERPADSNAETPTSTVEDHITGNQEFIITQDLLPVEEKPYDENSDVVEQFNADNTDANVESSSAPAEHTVSMAETLQSENNQAVADKQQETESHVEESSDTNDTPSADEGIETEKDIPQEDNAEPNQPESGINDDNTRPILRHLTLDDFVFGMDQQDQQALGKFEEEDDETESVTQKAKKPRRRRRKPAKPANNDNAKTPQKESDKKNETGKQSKPNSPKGNASSKTTDDNKSEAAKAKSRRRRRRPAKKAEE